MARTQRAMAGEDMQDIPRRHEHVRGLVTMTSVSVQHAHAVAFRVLFVSTALHKTPSPDSADPRIEIAWYLHQRCTGGGLLGKLRQIAPTPQERLWACWLMSVAAAIVLWAVGCSSLICAQGSNHRRRSHARVGGRDSTISLSAASPEDHTRIWISTPEATLAGLLLVNHECVISLKYISSSLDTSLDSE
ncbi:hypothetical protein K466DRAFT_234257 [Polyporus arcularius HHB13444]|uniref:Uncharacterized protein n=1 Tax=Polyporus arcularius HHB13444 TaxID=1314778 RepID=A0A5C3P5P9_9APHY|nr:hypothetical protein K466DRAFT_234257 [Polyporus arcularius HHB13444]